MQSAKIIKQFSKTIRSSGFTEMPTMLLSCRRYSSVATQQPVEEKKPDLLHGSYHWIYERAISVATLSLVAGAIVAPSKGIDFALGLVLPIHSHIGFGAIITDYLPAHKFPRIYPFARGALLAATIGTAYGLYLYNTNDLGICEGTRSLWKANKKHIQE